MPHPPGACARARAPRRSALPGRGRSWLVLLHRSELERDRRDRGSTRARDGVSAARALEVLWVTAVLHVETELDPFGQVVTDRRVPADVPVDLVGVGCVREAMAHVGGSAADLELAARKLVRAPERGAVPRHALDFLALGLG